MFASRYFRVRSTGDVGGAMRSAEALLERGSGRAKLICGTGTYSTAESLELTQAAEDAGADGLLVVTPYYNKPSQQGLYLHFKKIADNTLILQFANVAAGIPAANISLTTKRISAYDLARSILEGTHV